MRPTQRVRDVFTFIRRPTPHFARVPWSRPLVIALMTVFALDLVIDTSLQMMLVKLDDASGVMPELVDFPLTLAEDILLSILIAPVLEEALFRGWLSGTVAALRFGAIGFLALCVGLAADHVSPETAVVLSGLFWLVAIAGFIQWRMTLDRDKHIPDWFKPNYHWLVWGSSLLFGLYHLANFERLDNPLGLLVILPYTLGGVLLAYTRTRLGLGAAMVHHALYNAVALLISYELLPNPY